MRCPECDSLCWRNEVDVGVGLYVDSWKCDKCGWDEDLGEPMDLNSWERFLNDGWECSMPIRLGEI